MNDNYSILIPVDFSKASASAINYALGMSQEVHPTLTLMHLIGNEREYIAAEQQMEIFTSGFDFGEVTIQKRVMVGDVLDDLGKIAEGMNATIILMGTHGEKGLQKVFGSYALRIVENSKVPLIIVQEETVYKEIKKIVLTIDLEKESIQIVKNAAALAKYYGSEIILVGGKHDDPIFKNKVSLNMRICREFLSHENIKHDIQLLERKHFDTHLIEFCEKEHIDMLAASFYQNTFYAFSDKFVQHLIMNKLHIPMMTIDSTATGVYSQFTFITT
jgi:nucleotide-binding universal stress UspA family protein